ncbi:hypothetical protein AA313_de0206734 [Arthrobotrys entomopaga]|nr:hypothetical protein AA313_de0206734 [Arthrobotrys entomopaga]
MIGQSTARPISPSSGFSPMMPVSQICATSAHGEGAMDTSKMWATTSKEIECLTMEKGNINTEINEGKGIKSIGKENNEIMAEKVSEFVEIQTGVVESERVEEVVPSFDNKGHAQAQLEEMVPLSGNANRKGEAKIETATIAVITEVGVFERVWKCIHHGGWMRLVKEYFSQVVIFNYKKSM